MFSLSRPSSSTAGWTAVCLYPDRVDVARVRAGNAKPVVEMLESFERSGNDAQVLASVRRALKLDKCRCTTLLPVGHYQFLQLEAPDVPEDEVREAVRWKLRELVDFPVDQATLDVMEIPSPPAGGARARTMFAAACRNASLSPLIQSFHQAGLNLQAVDVLETAQRNVATLGENGERGQALLVLHEDVGLITFSAKGELYMVRRIDIGARQLAEAQDVRREQLLDRIALEVQRSLDNFDRQFSSIPVSRLLLGPGRQTASLHAFLLDYLGMPVEVLNLGELLDLSAIPGLDFPERQAQCFATLGAALRQDAP